MSVAIYYHPIFEKHEMGGSHPEQPKRITNIYRALQQSKLNSELTWVTPQKISFEDLLINHEEDYLKLLQRVSPNEGYYPLDPDTQMNPFSLEAALFASGAVKDAIEKVMDSTFDRALCLVRPPGHHAEPNQAMGFCFFNHIAVGAKLALKNLGLKKIAIVDFDVHHGNGTEAAFRNDNRVLFWSSFQHPFYPGVNLQDQPNHYLFYPLPAGTGHDEWQVLIQNHLKKDLLEFKPEIILVSAGFDAHQQDPLANINLTTQDYSLVTETIVDVAKTCCQGRVVSTLEGGYDLKALPEAYLAHAEAMNT